MIFLKIAPKRRSARSFTSPFDLRLSSQAAMALTEENLPARQMGTHSRVFQVAVFFQGQLAEACDDFSDRYSNTAAYAIHTYIYTYINPHTAV